MELDAISYTKSPCSGIGGRLPRLGDRWDKCSVGGNLRQVTVETVCRARGEVVLIKPRIKCVGRGTMGKSRLQPPSPFRRRRSDLVREHCGSREGNTSRYSAAHELASID